MMARVTTIKVSATEFPQFRLLVDFMAAVEDYARVCADDDLQAMVDDLRDRLADA